MVEWQKMETLLRLLLWFRSAMFACAILSETLVYESLGQLPYYSTRHTIVAGYYGCTLVVRESVRRLSVCPSSVHPSIFRFLDLSKRQWIFTTWYMCIDIVEILFGIANGQISSIFDGVICPKHAHIFIYGLKLESVTRDFHQTCYMH